MPWTSYQVILRLHSPLHIGWGRVSYLQRVRPYVTGRTLRGALVSRIARNKNEFGKTAGDPYRAASKTLAQFMTFTYFYPALQQASEDGESWKAHFPWCDAPVFRRRFLSSYAATSLEYPQQTAASSLLYETEFISPYTLDDGQPVYLMGYIFVDEERLRTERYDWKGALPRLQLGGERGYGWGEARLVEDGIRKTTESEKLFGAIRFELNAKRPCLQLECGQAVLAHTNSQTGCVMGQIEPMVGREWRANHQHQARRHIGQHLAFDDVFFVPGSRVFDECVFEIGEGGYWQEPTSSKREA